MFCDLRIFPHQQFFKIPHQLLMFIYSKLISVLLKSAIHKFRFDTARPLHASIRNRTSEILWHISYYVNIILLHRIENSLTIRSI